MKESKRTLGLSAFSLVCVSVVFLLLTPFCAAAESVRAEVFIYDGVQTWDTKAELSENRTAHKLIDIAASRHNINITKSYYEGFGTFIEAINGKGYDPVTGAFVQFLVYNRSNASGAWEMSQLGVDSFILEDGDIIALAYGNDTSLADWKEMYPPASVEKGFLPESVFSGLGVSLVFAAVLFLRRETTMKKEDREERY